MVNSGSFDSVDGNRNGKNRCSQSGESTMDSHPDADDAGTKFSSSNKSTDGDLPSDEPAIGPTPTQTEINSMSSKDAKELSVNKCSESLKAGPSDSTPKTTRKLLCLYCDRTFSSAVLRQKHVERVHSVKPTRRVSARRQNQLSTTPCFHCDKFASSEHSLNDLFQHLLKEHADKYFGCVGCEERFLTASHLSGHNKSKHSNDNVVTTSLSEVLRIEENVTEHGTIGDSKITRSKLRSKSKDILDVDEDSNLDKRRKKSRLKEIRNKKISVKSSKIAIKRSKRLQQQTKEHDSQKKKRDKKVANTLRSDATSSVKQPDKSKSSVNPYPEFDNFYRVKKITDHSIDNLKISSLTFDDVFDKAFFNRMKCNIEDNLLHHIDGKLFKNEESENRISNFEKVSTVAPEIQNSSADNYGCEISLNAVTPAPALSLNSQFGEDFESQIEYGSKPSKKKTQIKSDEVNYKYFTRRKYQASILQQKENRDLSKLDMWTQMLVKERQEKVLDKKKSAKEKLEYKSGHEYKSKIKRQELNRILDRRGPFEDLKAEVSKKAAFDKFSASDSSISQEVFTDVREVLNDLLNSVFEVVSEENDNIEDCPKEIDEREIPVFLNLRRKTSSTQEEFDKSDKIALICSSQETENFELPTNAVRGKNEMVELTGEWARSRMYICAACGGKFSNLKYLIEHKAVYHQCSWVQHYEFVGNQSELYRHLSIPGLGKVGVVEETVPCKIWKRSEARLCTKCGKQCNALGELHRHILECGGDWTWMLARKKCKYKPFGAKSRRKRRGFDPKIQKKHKTEPSEKKKYKKPIDGPRQRPSDAETIQRMLANLPAKRSRRSLVSLSDVVFKSRKTNTGSKSTTSANKINRRKSIHSKPKNELTGKHNAKQQMSSRALRSLNRVLSSRILDINSSLMVKRKMKTMRSKRLTRNTARTSAALLENMTNKEDITEDTLTTPSNKVVLNDKLQETKELITKPLTNKNKSVARRLLSTHLNLKNFFPVKKKGLRSLRKTAGLENVPVEPEMIVQESTAISTIPPKYLENFEHMKKSKRGGLKGFVRGLSLRKRNSRDEENLTITTNKPETKRNRTKNKQQVLENDKIEEGEKNSKIKNEGNTKASKKRKLQKSLRNVIDKVKKVKSEKSPKNYEANDGQNVQPFLEHAHTPKDSTALEKVSIPAEMKENLETVKDFAPIATSLVDSKENPPIPETIFNLDNNEEKSLQAKGELDFHDKETSQPEKKSVGNTLTPVSIDTSFKPKDIALISPTIKGKIKKPNRGLNDCIAMLTSKLHQKDDKNSSSLESLFSTSSIASTDQRYENKPLSELVPAHSKQKTECIPKIPTFTSLSSSATEETALDLSKKSVSTPNLMFNNDDMKDIPQKTITNDSWTSVDDIIQQVVQNSAALSTPIVTQTRKKSFNMRTHVDDTIDFVVNSSLEWFEIKNNMTRNHSKKQKRKKHFDDNLITNIIFGKDKLIIAPSSDNSEDPLIARIKENELKMSLNRQNANVSQIISASSFAIDRLLPNTADKTSDTKPTEPIAMHLHEEPEKNSTIPEKTNVDENLKGARDPIQRSTRNGVLLETNKDSLTKTVKLIENVPSETLSNGDTLQNGSSQQSFESSKQGSSIIETNTHDHYNINLNTENEITDTPVDGNICSVITESRKKSEVTESAANVVVQVNTDEISSSEMNDIPEVDSVANENCGDVLDREMDKIHKKKPLVSVKTKKRKKRKRTFARTKKSTLNIKQKSRCKPLVSKILEIPAIVSSVEAVLDMFNNPIEQTPQNNKVSPVVQNHEGSDKRSQRTRRKSKSSKKLDKIENELYKDFSLVINKKTQRIPPTCIVDDSVCDEIDSSFEKMSESKEHPRTPENIPEELLNDSVEEMDMEIEDIPINSSIIERDTKLTTEPIPTKIEFSLDSQELRKTTNCISSLIVNDLAHSLSFADSNSKELKINLEENQNITAVKSLLNPENDNVEFIAPQHSISETLDSKTILNTEPQPSIKKEKEITCDLDKFTVGKEMPIDGPSLSLPAPSKQLPVDDIVEGLVLSEQQNRDSSDAILDELEKSSLESDDPLLIIRKKASAESDSVTEFEKSLEENSCSSSNSSNRRTRRPKIKVDKSSLVNQQIELRNISRRSRKGVTNTIFDASAVETEDLILSEDQISGRRSLRRKKTEEDNEQIIQDHPSEQEPLNSRDKVDQLSVEIKNVESETQCSLPIIEDFHQPKSTAPVLLDKLTSESSSFSNNTDQRSENESLRDDKLIDSILNSSETPTNTMRVSRKRRRTKKVRNGRFRGRKKISYSVIPAFPEVDDQPVLINDEMPEINQCESVNSEYPQLPTNLDELTSVSCDIDTRNGQNVPTEKVKRSGRRNRSMKKLKINTTTASCTIDSTEVPSAHSIDLQNIYSVNKDQPEAEKRPTNSKNRFNKNLTIEKQSEMVSEKAVILPNDSLTSSELNDAECQENIQEIPKDQPTFKSKRYRKVINYNEDNLEQLSFKAKKSEQSVMSQLGTSHKKGKKLSKMELNNVQNDPAKMETAVLIDVDKIIDELESVLKESHTQSTEICGETKNIFKGDENQDIAEIKDNAQTLKPSFESDNIDPIPVNISSFSEIPKLVVDIHHADQIDLINNCSFLEPENLTDVVANHIESYVNEDAVCHNIENSVNSTMKPKMIESVLDDTSVKDVFYLLNGGDTKIEEPLIKPVDVISDCSVEKVVKKKGKHRKSRDKSIMDFSKDTDDAECKATDVGSSIFNADIVSEPAVDLSQITDCNLELPSRSNRKSRKSINYNEEILVSTAESRSKKTLEEKKRKKYNLPKTPELSEHMQNLDLVELGNIQKDIHDTINKKPNASNITQETPIIDDQHPSTHASKKSKKRGRTIDLVSPVLVDNSEKKSSKDIFEFDEDNSCSENIDIRPVKKMSVNKIIMKTRPSSSIKEIEDGDLSCDINESHCIELPDLLADIDLLNPIAKITKRGEKKVKPKNNMDIDVSNILNLNDESATRRKRKVNKSPISLDIIISALEKPAQDIDGSNLDKYPKPLTFAEPDQDEEGEPDFNYNSETPQVHSTFSNESLPSSQHLDNSTSDDLTNVILDHDKHKNIDESVPNLSISSAENTVMNDKMFSSFENDLASTSVEDMIVESRSSIDRKNKGKSKIEKLSFSEKRNFLFKTKTDIVTTNTARPDAEYNLSKINIKELLLSSLAPPSSSVIETDQITNSHNMSDMKSTNTSESLSHSVLKETKLKVKKKNKNTKTKAVPEIPLQLYGGANEEDNKKLEDLNFTELLNSFSKSGKDDKFEKGHTIIFSEIQPLSEIISSSEMDIAPVLDEIDKSLESEDIYDFDDEMMAINFECKPKNSKTKNKSNLRVRTLSARSAKVKALESIHEKVLIENSDIPSLPLQPKTSKKSKFNSNSRQDFTKKEITLTIEELDKGESLFSKEEDINATHEKGDTEPNPLLESHDLNQHIETSTEKSSLVDSDNLELRRSRRGSKKITSYNENDLIDPLIDALENRRNKNRKDKSVEKQPLKFDTSAEFDQQKPKLSSEELFDILKNSSEQVKSIAPKPISFFDNLNTDGDVDETSNGDFDDMTVYGNDSPCESEPSKNPDGDKIYEFTDDSSENTKRLKDSLEKSKKQSTVADDGKITKYLVTDVNSLESSHENQTNVSEEQPKSNYCDICKKSFIRVENLMKHKMTLTHISKLSELEAREAEERARLEKESSIEEQSESSLKTIDTLRDEINITDILQQSRRNNVSIPETSPPILINDQSLKLVDIISDVLNKPVMRSYVPEVANIENTSARRYKSLGERKSFDSESHTTNPSSFIPNALSQATILANQINLLENIIGNNLESIAAKEREAAAFKEDSNSCTNSSSAMDNADQNSSSSIRSELDNGDNDVDFVKPSQYEEISEDSTGGKPYEDSKQRKTLNRDEELFLECCSLLKSSSEVSNSNVTKVKKPPSPDNLEEYVKPEIIENKKLIQTAEDAHEFSDNSRTPTPLGDTYDDEASNSNTISSNWHLNSDKTQDKNRSLSFEDFKSKEDAGMSYGEILSKGHRNQFENTLKTLDRTTNKHEESPCDDQINNIDSTNCGYHQAKSVYEGLKVSIPTEDLNLDLINSPLNRRCEAKLTEEILEPSPTTKSRSTRKSKPVKKSQVGCNLLFKVNKKKTIVDSDPVEKQLSQYDFEDREDSDVFVKPTTKLSSMKDALMSSDTESLGYADSIGADAKSVSNVSSISAISAKKAEPVEENITKKKYKIMGKIFKNAAKSKLDEVDEEFRNIPEIPEIDNLELVENYVRSCQSIRSPFPPPLPPAPFGETHKKSKMSETEMNLLFDQLIGKEDDEHFPEKPVGKTSAKPKNVEQKYSDGMKKKNGKLKSRKRVRGHSDSSGDEFNINARKKRSYKKKDHEDSGINLEQELKECIGVASRKSQRTCTSGKQNVLVEYWSSDEELFEAMLESKKISNKPPEIKNPIDKPQEVEEISIPDEVQAAVMKPLKEKPPKVKPPRKKPQNVKKLKVNNKSVGNKSTTTTAATNRRKRAAANPLYHWSSSSEDESHSLIEVKPIREEDDDDRPIQHGWIVGDSPKKLVTMLALTKGKKTDIDCVKEQGKKRTSNANS